VVVNVDNDTVVVCNGQHLYTLFWVQLGTIGHITYFISH